MSEEYNTREMSSLMVYAFVWGDNGAMFGF
jgi:hypothetical protein